MTLARTAKSGDTIWLASSVVRNVLSVPTVVVTSKKFDVEIRLLGDDIDRTADRVAAGDAAARTLVDFDLLDGEYLRDEIARIADVVDEDVVVGLEATDREGAIGIAAFGRADGQPRNRTGEVAQILLRLCPR